ncbi:MAG: protein kinase, partial [Planctomycetales bacterium]|nr:protein kinase [Planctomycetales bacterium]
MTSDESSTTDSDSTSDLNRLSCEELLGQAASEYFEEIAAGQSPDIEAYAKRYPTVASHIRRTFPAMQFVRDTKVHASDHVEVELPQECLGDFRILREIGRGGMGIVYEAEQLSMARRVALKVLPCAGLVNEIRLQRFQNEVRAVAALDHPHIVSVYYVGQERGIHFYAMQLIRGSNLSEVIASLRRLTSLQPEYDLDGDSLSEAVSLSGDAAKEVTSARNDAKQQFAAPPTPASGSAARTPLGGSSSTRREYFRSVAELGIQAAGALQHAHELGVVHRDIKPGNLMIDGATKLYVTDFGLARVESHAGITMSGDMLGTLRYMAPEQALAIRVEVDHRADVYSLGITLYELIALTPAYPEMDRKRLLKQIAFEDPLRLSKLVPTVPPELETIIVKAISKDMEDRYQSAGELADDLRNFLENRPISAKRVTIPQRINKWIRRNPSYSFILMATLLLISLVLSVSSALISQARNQSDALGYVNSMWVGFAAWTGSDLAQVYSALLENIPDSPTKSDYRDIAWYLLASICERMKSTVLTETSGPWCVSADGRVLASYAHGRLSIINLMNRETIGQVELTVDTKAVAISPNGTQVLIAGDNGVWSYDTTNKRLDQISVRPAYLVAVSPNTSSYASLGQDDVLEYWSADAPRDLTEVKVFEIAHKELDVRLLTFAPDSQRIILVRAANQEGVIVWNTVTRERQVVDVDTWALDLRHVCLVNSEYLLVGSPRELTPVRITTDESPTTPFPALPLRTVQACCVSPDGRRLALSVWKGLELWDLEHDEPQLLWQ